MQTRSFPSAVDGRSPAGAEVRILIEVTARRGGETLTFRTVEIYEMRDGKIVERWAFSDDTEAIKRFFA